LGGTGRPYRRGGRVTVAAFYVAIARRVGRELLSADGDLVESGLARSLGAVLG
jgi:predicted nucleic acid-binding protein